MFEFEVGYKTGSGNKMALTVYGKNFDREDIPIDVPGLYCVHNGIECGGYNGGCPPYSPKFENIKKAYPFFYVICIRFDLAYAIKYAGLKNGKHEGYFVLSYADRLTMHYIQRALKYFEARGYYALGASNCPGCTPKRCTITRGRTCSNPKKRRFSLEATGVECHKLHRNMFMEVLPWWYRTPKHVPVWMYRYAGVFCERDTLAEDDLLEEFAWNDSSFHNLIPEHNRKRLIMKIPEGAYDGGEDYLVYSLEGE